MRQQISIVVPIYNVEKYIRRCIESICNQSYTDIQMILVDDGCIDNSGLICEEYAKSDKRICVVHHGTRCQALEKTNKQNKLLVNF